MIVTDQLAIPTKTVPLKSITTNAAAHDFVHDCVLSYNKQKMVSCDNRSQFMKLFFTEVFQRICTKNLYTATYHSQCSK